MVTLGKKHRARERAAQLAARAARQEAVQLVTQCRERWTHIVVAIAEIVAAYNVAFDRDALTIAEDGSDPHRPAVTVQGVGESRTFPSLLASLEGTLICVRSRDAEGLSCETEYRLRPDRDDAQTAAYILQRWMERL